MEVRAAAQGDLAAIQGIYAHHVLHGLATFEEIPPDLEEMRQRHRDITGRGLPYLVAVERNEILGYGYCAPYRARSAYRYALEDSIYIKDGHLGKGIGARILGDLVRLCEATRLPAGDRGDRRQREYRVRSRCTRGSASCASARCAPRATSSAAGWTGC